MPNIQSTVFPSAPAKDFNEWSNHIYRLRNGRETVNKPTYPIIIYPTYFLYIKPVNNAKTP